MYVTPCIRSQQFDELLPMQVPQLFQTPWRKLTSIDIRLIELRNRTRHATPHDRAGLRTKQSLKAHFYISDQGVNGPT